jgi:hypothetical protein
LKNKNNKKALLGSLRLLNIRLNDIKAIDLEVSPGHLTVLMSRQFHRDQLATNISDTKTSFQAQISDDL